MLHRPLLSLSSTTTTRLLPRSIATRAFASTRSSSSSSSRLNQHQHHHSATFLGLLTACAAVSSTHLSRPLHTMAPIEVNGGAAAEKPSKHNKVVIIGSGPAGHTAAIYLARANLEPVMFEGMLANGVAAGGQLTTTTEVENFPGFPEGIRGPEMMDLFRAQSIRFGTKVHTETVSKVDLSSRPFKYWREGAEQEEPETAETIIIATGASARRLHLPGEETYWQSGISACAVCDGAVPIFRKKPLAVIGGGDSACEEAMYLTKVSCSFAVIYGSHVYVIVRRDVLRASKIMANRLLKHPKVTVLWNTEPVEAKGDGDLLQALVIKDTKTGETKDLPINGLFYAIDLVCNGTAGHEPATSLVRGQLKTDEDGYIITEPGTSLTSVKGVFAAGDVQDKKYRQAITSAGTGCIAALEAERLLAEEEVHDQ
ncbi:BZ3500_MvSof-1268-A1-R1_Chr4-2g07092 [Microbotryum saponariae]|uniref:Thioredoxin reductase n=1 Tax=Microbotryum saponariae TaxID=289078 RepID=A0A2X0NM13_9BASI|nr:BZ3500_MvSof-1268-A1-R1_Chr4-2g07092 [Microbotryum saponariae]SDA06757.1 BZ3501_MvSof-1269-A2-R1_Chr4-2g06803 [Microbotryum saponariae]